MHNYKSGNFVERLVVEGAVAPSIHAVAEETDADMVVMSTHALTGLARAVLGSVADAVVRTSQRPVLLVRRSGGALDDMEDTAETASEVVILSLAGDKERQSKDRWKKVRV